MQVIFKGSYWLRFWRSLQKEDLLQDIKDVCCAMEVVAIINIYYSTSTETNAYFGQIDQTQDQTEERRIKEL
jgi:hypothetical protein